MALHEEEIDEWNEVFSESYKNLNLSRVYKFIDSFHKVSVREYTMSDEAKKVYCKWKDVKRPEDRASTGT